MTQSRLIHFQWVIIGVLVVGFGIVTLIAMNRAKAIDQARSAAQGSILSLQEQVRQAKEDRKTSPTLSESVENQATPTPAAKATPAKATGR